MKRPITPVKTKVVSHTGNDTQIKKTHPAFAMLGFYRTQGGSKERLFGSEVATPHTICMRVVPAEVNWHLSQQWFFGHTTPIIEVELTPAQFAEAITCMNIGDGVPCTLRELRVPEELEPYTESTIPDFVEDDTVTSMIIDDVKADVADVVKEIGELVVNVEATLDEAKVSAKRKEAIMGALRRLHMKLNSSMPFVLTQYREAIETMQAHAKAEMDATVTHMITKLGLKSLEQLTALGEGESQTPAQ
jgi:hypothetical protein